MEMLAYHCRLALRSLRRDLSFSLAMVCCLALSSSIWGGALAHYLRLHESHRPWSRQAFAIDAQRGDTQAAIKAMLPGDWRRQNIVLNWSEYAKLKHTLASPIGGNYRANFLVQDQAHQLVMARMPGRFTDGLLFSLFPRRFAWGQPWTAADEQAQRPVVVLSRVLNQQMFGGGNSVGRTLNIEGRAFRVVGVLADHQPYLPSWDLAAGGADQDRFMVPLTLAPVLAVPPEYETHGYARTSTIEALLASPKPFIATWVQTPSAQAVRVQTQIEALIGTHVLVRPLAEHRRNYPLPPQGAEFFTVLCALVILVGGFSMTRLLFAKSVARQKEIGVHRALGASRASLFVRTMIEAAMVALAGAILTVPLLQLLLWFFNARHLTNDVPLAFTNSLLLAATLPAFVVGLAAGLYPAWRVAHTRPTLYLARV